MDEFRKMLIARQLLLTAGLLGACSAVMLTRNYVKATSASETAQAFIGGFQVGILAILLGALLYFIIRNILAMRDQERMKKLYVYETDERRKFIRQQSGSMGMNIILYGLAAGTVVAGNFNDTVFFTLLGACLFVSLVRSFLKLYYRKKY